MPDSTLKPLGNTGLNVSAVGLGCWPFAGVTSLGVEDSQSVRTIRTALEHGINLLDTAFSYGADGRSDKVLKEALTNVPRDKYVLCSKVGTLYDSYCQLVVYGQG